MGAEPALALSSAALQKANDCDVKSAKASLAACMAVKTNAVLSVIRVSLVFLLLINFDHLWAREFVTHRADVTQSPGTALPSISIRQPGITLL